MQLRNNNPRQALLCMARVVGLEGVSVCLRELSMYAVKRHKMASASF